MEEKNNTFKEIWEKLLSSKNILIPLHPKPDGDTFGSSVAMKKALEKEGKNVTVISKDVLSENLNAFSFSKEVEFEKEISDFDLEKFDILLFLDHGTLKGHPQNVIDQNFPDNLSLIKIDHHHTNDYKGDLVYVDKRSPSCCSILVEFFQTVEAEFDKAISRALFLGICTDTSFFIHGNSLDSITKAEFLIKEGKIDYFKEFYQKITSDPWNLKKLHGILLNNMEKISIGEEIIAYSYISQDKIKENGLSLSDLRLGIMCMQNIKGIDVKFTITEMKDSLKGSFRATDTDTSLFSSALGGGGHKLASAFYLEKMPLNDAKKKVIETIKEIGFHKV